VALVTGAGRRAGIGHAVARRLLADGARVMLLLAQAYAARHDDTGYADPALHRLVAQAFPSRRWTTPDDVAAVVSWLVGPDSGLITGQVIDAEGGFRR
jgi:NAD(P)-dependent dehydrogenase (short-subunit alcohol dehydrogenase family)